MCNSNTLNSPGAKKEEKFVETLTGDCIDLDLAVDYDDDDEEDVI